MIITVAAVRMVQMTCHEVIDMIAVGDRVVPTADAMGMALVMSAAAMRRRAGFRVIGIHTNATLIDMIRVRVVHMTVVKIIAVIPVLNRFVTAAGSMLVIVILMLLVVAHGVFLSIPMNGILSDMSNFKTTTIGSVARGLDFLNICIYSALRSRGRFYPAGLIVARYD